MDMVKELAEARNSPWISRGERLPENDYDHQVLIMFNDGHMTLSDGGTVHDDENISLWKELSTSLTHPKL
jgi:hypothetical protein